MPVEVVGLLPFETVREPWNEYVIKDEGQDVILRGRLILAKVTRMRDTADPKRVGVQVAPHPIWTTHSPPGLRGEPSPQLPPFTAIPAEEKKLVEVETTREAWNVYRFTEDKVEFRLRLVITRVYRVPKYYAVDGEPYYVVESAVLSEVLREGRPVDTLNPGP